MTQFTPSGRTRKSDILWAMQRRFSWSTEEPVLPAHQVTMDDWKWNYVPNDCVFWFRGDDHRETVGQRTFLEAPFSGTFRRDWGCAYPMSQRIGRTAEGTVDRTEAGWVLATNKGDGQRKPQPIESIRLFSSFHSDSIRTRPGGSTTDHQISIPFTSLASKESSANHYSLGGRLKSQC